MLLHVEIVLGMPAGGDQLPATLLLLRVHDVVARPLLGIAEHSIRFADLPEARGVTGFAIVRMKPLREETIDAVDRLDLRVWS